MLAWSGLLLVLYLRNYLEAKWPQVLTIAQDAVSRRWPPVW